MWVDSTRARDEGIGSPAKIQQTEKTDIPSEAIVEEAQPPASLSAVPKRDLTNSGSDPLVLPPTIISLQANCERGRLTRRKHTLQPTIA